MIDLFYFVLFDRIQNMTASGASALQKGYISFEFDYCQAQVQEGQSQVRFSSETWLVGWYDKYGQRRLGLQGGLQGRHQEGTQGRHQGVL